jgi:acyl dehydratase
MTDPGAANTAFSEQSLKAYQIAEVEQSITPDQCMLYSLSVGLGSDPMDAGQLRYVYENDLCANPLMANVLAYPGFWMKAEDTGVDWKQVLHGEQFFELHRPIPTSGTLVGRTRVIGVNDRGKEKGAFVYSRREVFDKLTGDAVCTVDQTVVCRGNGGCGGDDAAPRSPHQLPKRKADTVCDLPISTQAALLYRLNGDRNPLHADPAVATDAGYPQPILHGLCTLGIAGHAILRNVCDYDATRLKSMAVRFTAPVFPGETLRTEIWHEDNGASFRASVIERDKVVLGNGHVTLTS